MTGSLDSLCHTNDEAANPDSSSTPLLLSPWAQALTVVRTFLPNWGAGRIVECFSVACISSNMNEVKYNLII